jgi:hypothetical protein
VLVLIDFILVGWQVQGVFDSGWEKVEISQKG